MSRTTIGRVDFCQALETGAILCEVRSPLWVVAAAWGVEGLVGFALGGAFVLGPALGVAAMASTPWELAWVAPCLVAFLMSRPALNMLDGGPYLLCAIAGVLAAVLGGPLHLFAGFAPLLTWVLAGTWRGLTIHRLLEVLATSESLLLTTQEQGLLVVRRVEV